MSGENESRPSSWTTDTLKIYLERRVTDLEKSVDSAMVASKEAIAKADAANEKRFDSVNEFRKTLSDQTSTFISRLEYAAQHKSLEDKVQLLTDLMNQSRGGQITMTKIYAAIGAVGATLAIVVLLANKVS